MTSDYAALPEADLFGPPQDDPALTPDGAGEGSAGEARSPGAAGGDQPEPVYYALEDWVIDHFLPMFRRTLGGEFRWCAQWWKHDEAVSRLTALWQAWEVLRLQPGTGMGAWYRDHLDHQLPILMGARGPFYQCSETSHREPRETTVKVAPGDWWDSDQHLPTAGTGPWPFSASRDAGTPPAASGDGGEPPVAGGGTETGGRRG